MNYEGTTCHIGQTFGGKTLVVNLTNSNEFKVLSPPNTLHKVYNKYNCQCASTHSHHDVKYAESYDDHVL